MGAIRPALVALAGVLAFCPCVEAGPPVAPSSSQAGSASRIFKRDNLLLLAAVTDWGDFLAGVRDSRVQAHVAELEAIRARAMVARNVEELRPVELDFDAWQRSVIAELAPGAPIASAETDKYLELAKAQVAAFAAVERRQLSVTGKARRTWEKIKARLSLAQNASAVTGVFSEAGLSVPEGVSAVSAGSAQARFAPGRRLAARAVMGYYAPASLERTSAGKAASPIDPAQIAAILGKRKKGGPSVSLGQPFRRGRLKNGMALPMRGVGYVYVNPERGRNYGTDDLVMGLAYLAADFKRRHPEHPGLRLGDLSRKGGGPVSDHGSHENGRDADIIFLAADLLGRPVDIDRFNVHFDAKGRAGDLLFDAALNWDLVVLLCQNPYFGEKLEAIGVDDSLRIKLLSYARKNANMLSGVEQERAVWQIRRAERMLFPWANHTDHFHIRIAP